MKNKVPEFAKKGAGFSFRMNLAAYAKTGKLPIGYTVKQLFAEAAEFAQI